MVTMVWYLLCTLPGGGCIACECSGPIIEFNNLRINAHSPLDPRGTLQEGWHIFTRLQYTCTIMLPDYLHEYDEHVDYLSCSVADSFISAQHIYLASTLLS